MARERAAVSALACACLLHTLGAPSHATLHHVALGMLCPALPSALLSNSRHINALYIWHGPCLLS